MACAFGKGGGDCVRLLASGHAVEADKAGLSPLHLAADEPESVRLLLEAGADVDGVDASGDALVHVAAAQGSLPLLRLLAERKVDLAKFALFFTWTRMFSL